MLIYRL